MIIQAIERSFFQASAINSLLYIENILNKLPYRKLLISEEMNTTRLKNASSNIFIPCCNIDLVCCRLVASAAGVPRLLYHQHHMQQTRSTAKTVLGNTERIRIVSGLKSANVETDINHKSMFCSEATAIAILKTIISHKQSCMKLKFLNCL